MSRSRLGSCCAIALIAAASSTATADLIVDVTFDPPSTAPLCGLATSPDGLDLWFVDCLGGTVDGFACAGGELGSFALPFDPSDAIDLDIAATLIPIAGTTVQPGTILVFDGENGDVELYALDPMTGALLTPLTTDFGSSAVVGGGYHPPRDTFYLVQSVAGGDEGNRVAEIDPTDGSILLTFDLTPSGFVVEDDGDIDVDPDTGNLLIASATEPRLAEFTPDGVFVGFLDLPESIGPVSGLSVLADGRLWVGTTDGLATLLADTEGGAGEGSDCPGDLNFNDSVDFNDLLFLLSQWGPVAGCTTNIADLDTDGTVGFTDLLLVLSTWGPCP